MDGLIIKNIADSYTVLVSEEEHICKQKGSFKHKEDKPMVGDYVEIDSDNRITGVKSRKNSLIRPNVANIDTLFLVFSIEDPCLNLMLLDRLISETLYHGIKPVIIFTKSDLDSKIDIAKIRDYYETKVNVACIMSDNTMDKDTLLRQMSEKGHGTIWALAGQSGVGKTTLINLLTGLNGKTQETSKALGRGKCTTRHTELVRLPYLDKDIYCADAPGFGTLEGAYDNELDISLTFNDFQDYRNNCKFNHCLHVHETGCAVKSAVNQGLILKSRYENYKTLLEEYRSQQKNKY